MRFKRSEPKCDEQASACSSVQSVNSCGIFDSACSDDSDRDQAADTLQHNVHITPFPRSVGAPGRGRSAMFRSETAPLLISTTPTYSSTDDTSDTLGPGDLSSREILYTYQKQLEKPEKPETKKQSSLITIFSVWNTIMGSSLLTMAWGVERAGLPAALVLVAVMAALCLYTAYLLLNVSANHGGATCEVPALCRLLLGRSAERLAHAFSLLVLLGANIVYWILITNFLYFTVNYFIDLSKSNGTEYNTTVLCPNHGMNGSLIIAEPVAESPYWGLHTTVPIYVAIIIFPLLSFGDVTFFTKFNSLGTLSVVYLLAFVIVKGYTWGVNVSGGWGEERAGRDAAVLSGMLALSFYIHNIIITIMSNNARQDRNGRDLTIAFVLVTVTYTLVGAVFYICFPLAKSCIEDNILNNFEMHDVMTAVARMLLLFQVVTVYPLVAYLLRTEALRLLPLPARWGEARGLAVAANIVLVVLCILAACFCPNIGTIIRYTGAVSGLVHVFALPALLHARSLQLRGRLTCAKGLLCLAILLFGTVNLLMQFFITE